MPNPDADFEFERRFFVDQLPEKLLIDVRPTVIVQTYFLAESGYALRVRLQATRAPHQLPPHVDGKAALELFADYFNLCLLTVKGPAVGGTRYEAERQIDVAVGTQMCLLGGVTISKLRYGVWLDQDGWVIDEFCGKNRPLVIAECERISPVIDLAIPSFCRSEITDDHRFSNDALSQAPFGTWAQQYHDELATTGSHFHHHFGTNSSSSA